MDQTAQLTGWLAGLQPAELARVLSNRPDVLLAPEPRNLTELGQRLGDSPESLAAALRGLPLPCAQLAEAMVALDASASLAGLIELLSDRNAPAEHPEHVEHWVRVLSEHGIVWIDANGRLGFAAALGTLFPSPLGLGPPLRTLLPETSVDVMRRILNSLGVPKPPTRRAEVVGELSQLLGDPQEVRRVVGAAPVAVAQELVDWAREGQEADADGALPSSLYDPTAYARRRTASTWALDRGLVFGRAWAYGWQMPAEVTRALRGREFRAPFTPVPPAVDVRAVDGAQRATESKVAVSRFADLALALVDRLARTPLPALKSGGVGTRELAKLSKALGCDEVEVRLVLELCAAVGVLDVGGSRCQLSAEADSWRAAPPADRVSRMVIAWWQLPRAATQARDDTGKATPALATAACKGCLLARHNLVLTIAELGERQAGVAAQLARRALWRRPFGHVLPQDAQDPFSSIFTEAGLLGVVALGSVTELGHALITGQTEALRELLRAALPAANDRALFGADLTVVVAGAPAATVSRLLDAAADRESRGGATVWRFTPGSIRRAMDEGQSAAGLEGALADIATGELPQSLRYLIADIGRRHGNLTVAPAVSTVRSDDEALLRQVCADRSLRKLGLRLLAPSVLAADADARTVLSTLRAAGYLPMPDADSAPVAESPREAAQSAFDAAMLAEIGQRLRLEDRDSPAVADPARLAAQLLAQPIAADLTSSPTEELLGAAARSLSPGEIRILAYAVDRGEPVVIDYQGQSGNVTRRAIVPRELTGGAIVAWCELRSDERWFRIDRIRSVVPYRSGPMS